MLMHAFACKCLYLKVGFVVDAACMQFLVEVVYFVSMKCSKFCCLFSPHDYFFFFEKGEQELNKRVHMSIQIDVTFKHMGGLM